jgi:hypothetical protein
LVIELALHLIVDFCNFINSFAQKTDAAGPTISATHHQDQNFWVASHFIRDRKIISLLNYFYRWLI